ncbi:hypothetical protein GTA08_BOTSDO04543 [Neofusicoccum parvum]|nr:hypothetical protein GTA08_BOTSDO04543 [Neofusicoccum parvum]
MAKTKPPPRAGLQPAAGSSPPPAPALIICRNKHWRYISSFHGPWLQLPPEILESLANSNFQAPRPHPVDPAVFYDLVKIRKAVDEATNLAVRAASGLTSAALSSQANAANGILGSAAQLGLGYVGGGQNTKLSRERKYRMRELATQKLSHAYHLDEIAASVATMQSASTLEDVAQFVLQRTAADSDAKYVHFFHEKIPSRMMAEYTPLDPLNDIICERPNDSSPLRTRALAKLFKEDYTGAARDLTDGLAIARYIQQQHRVGNDQLVLARTAREEAEARRANPREWRDQPVKEEDQPSSLETQLLFHRAGTYFTLACQHVHEALDGLKDFEAQRNMQKDCLEPGIELPSLSPEDKEANRRRLENRKLVKTYAKRALRDYIAFLSHFDYTPGLNPAVAEDFLRKVNDVANGAKNSKSSYRERIQELTDSSPEVNGQTSDALIPCQRDNESSSPSNSSWSLPPPEIHQVSALFSSTPPPNLPPYPPPQSHPARPPNNGNPTLSAFADSQEAVTYHPLLPDALHSLLLCHALAQTPPTELRRHACNAARVARVCDGYPVFLAARSPARADWIDVLRRAGAGWLDLGAPWDQLCRPAPLPSSCGQEGGGGGAAESDRRRGERRRQEAVLDALADERVVDEKSFKQAVRARERGNGDAAVAGEGPGGGVPQQKANGNAKKEPRRWAQEDGREYPVCTERAEAVARWVREAPRGGGEKKRKGRKAGRRKKGDDGKGDAGGGDGGVEGLEEGVNGLGVKGEDEDEEIDE